ncbi:HAD superfamily phosphatase (TIGR01681 family)/FkbH-like protein/amino acid adenylation domain-containing protein [Pedobacter psychrotolerans]|uniref:HAD superfamily phosphatase (TIGR01681 family)/FkbH-like protein/amino acid adenylation domain-containing protein n=1 Tax=Pedobacter psychrotolerans TaxID=1843235 RepID=A0A4R2HC17_9SPHI|nr:non-ribosomal peptide synthetase [Pedobacter psychrotolerans]TCO25226.1 HAD superfamily phosphatase (TIGR01681 family)/FkbH-like protein/amino acid adenylation domain-containing protein [Pedobacter psychrotolerans]GGE47107.1 hypothetical protein GCM10011413_11530 [Pedobacter psychrotolerans]
MEQLSYYRLSPQQQHFFKKYKDHHIPYTQVTIKITGVLEPERLKSSLSAIINRYSIFRTTYIKPAGIEWPVQVINDFADFIFGEHMITNPDALSKIIKIASKQVFDLENGPLVRLDVVNGPDEVNHILMTTPALCADFYSINVLANQLIAGYLAGNDATATPEEALPYLQFSEWQNQLLEAEENEDGITYWKKNSFIAQMSAMIFDEDPLNTAVFDPGVYALQLPPSTHADEDLEARLGVCWQWLIWNFCGKQDIITQHINNGRDFEELHDIMGLLSFCLPISLAIDENTSFAFCLEAYRDMIETNGEYKLLHEVSGRPDATYSYVFEFINSPLSIHNQVINDGLIEVLNRETLVEAKKIQLRCINENGALNLEFIYNKNAFSKESIQLLAEVYSNITAQCFSDTTIRLNNLQLLPASLLDDMMESFNPHHQVFPASSYTVDEMFDKAAARYPEAIAVVAGDKRISYAELSNKANRLTDYLIKEKSIRPGDRIGLLCEENEHMIVGMLGIIKAGAAFVPIDPRSPVSRTLFILEDSSAKVLLSHSSLGNMLDDKIDTVWIDELILNENQVAAHFPVRKTDAVVYVIYTSGTTGKPKSVLISDQSLVNYVSWLRAYFEVTEKDSAVLLSSYAFDLGYTSVWGMLLGGGCLHLIPDNLIRNPGVMVQYIADEKITFLKTTPSLFQLLVSATNADLFTDSALRLVIMGGEPIRVPDLKKMISIKPSVQLANHYGPTETTIGTIAILIDNNKIDSYATHPVIGYPIANSFVSILDEHGHYAVPGVAGELCISGAGLASGYLNNDELTREKFTDHPRKPGSIMYKTGDQACWTLSGTIVFKGRKDDQVKIRGYRIELNEVRNALLRYEDINRVAVIAIENDVFGKELAAYYESNVPVSPKQLRDFLNEFLPDAFIPSYFVPMKSLPITANGKIDVKSLPAVDAGNETAYVLPSNRIEEEMITLWEAVLGKTRIGITDNFFDLGGHSLKAIQLTSHIHKHFNVKLDIGKIFAYPTVNLLAKLIPGATEQQFSEIPALAEKEDFQLSHAQQRLWVLSQFEEGNAAYNVPSATLLEGKLDTAKFKYVLEKLIARHESLRTVFITVNGAPRQLILPPADINFLLNEKDLGHTANSAEVIEKMITEDMHAPFNLSKGPLLRATLVRVAEEKYIFLFNIHHIVSDGWSRNILTRELLHLYRFYATGIGKALSPLTLQYRDYAAWHTGIYQSQGKYWNDLYQNNIPVLRFPADFERPEVLSFSGGSLVHELSAELTDRLKAFALERNTTLNNLLFALYGMLLAHYTDQQDLVIGSLVSGRSHIDLENMLGVFINFLPVRITANKNDQLDDYLRFIHQTLVNAYLHQDYPFDLMVDDCLSERDRARNPFFDTMVNFHSETSITGRDLSTGDTGIRMSPYIKDQNSEVHAVLDFKLDIYPLGNEIKLYFTYNKALFKEPRMATFLTRYTDLLEDIIAHPSQPLSAYFPWVAEPSELPQQSELSITICSSFVADPLKEYMEYWGKEVDLGLKIDFAPYNQVFQQLYDENSILCKNEGLNIVFIRPEDWLRDQPTLNSKDQSALLEKTYNELLAAFSHSRNSMLSPCFVGVVPASASSNYDIEVINTINKLCQLLTDFFTSLTGCYLLDMNGVTELYEVDEIFDNGADNIGHITFTPEYYAALGTFLVRKIYAWKTAPYKVIAVDCDHTLWKGIVGEAGLDGIKIDGQYAALQRFLVEKYHEGFLIVLASKNNEADVWNVFDHHPQMVLQRSHIITHRINWEHKPDNLKSIAHELNLGTDSFIFLDDSEFEVEQVTARCPEVLAMVIPEDPADMTDFLLHNWAFDRFYLTEEDLERNDRYKAEKERNDVQTKSDSLAGFIASLNIKVNMLSLTNAETERAVQLIQRTNQFNMNGLQRTSKEVQQIINAPDSFNRIIHVEDRFGNYGLAGLIISRVDGNSLLLENFMLSCRVLGRGVEDIVLRFLHTDAAQQGLSQLVAKFIPTAKNTPFKQFLERTQWIETGIQGRYALAVVQPE